MVRKLPWERTGLQKRASASADRRSFSPARAGPSRRDDDDSNDARDSGHDRQKRPQNTGSPSTFNSATRFRTPSTSPPPAPPSDAFMIDGLEHDDGYRMVEDELLAVAQAFTAHLHAAEYQRLKAKAKEQAKASGGSSLLPRPVTIAPTERVTKRNEMNKRRATQKKALKKAAGKADSDDSDADPDTKAPWAGTSLQNLMEGGPQKAKPSLASFDSLVKKGATLGKQKERQSEMTRLKYRPLAGSSSLKTVESIDMSAGETQSLADDDDDDDDLDGPATKETRNSKRNMSTSGRTETSRPGPSRTTQTTATKRTVSFAPKASEIPPSHSGSKQVRGGEGDGNGEDDDDDDISDMDGGSLMDKIRRRREQEKADRQRRLQQQRQARGG